MTDMNFDDLLNILVRGVTTGDDAQEGGSAMPTGDYVVWRGEDLGEGDDVIIVEVRLAPRIDDDSTPPNVVGVMSIEGAYRFALDLLAAAATDDDTAALWEYLRGQIP